MGAMKPVAILRSMWVSLDMFAWVADQTFFTVMDRLMHAQTVLRTFSAKTRNFQTT
jgi:hypothetical protein